MKNFITSMLGAFVALVAFSVGAVLLFIGFIGAIVALNKGNKAPVVEDGSYLVFDLASNITDAPPAFDLGDLTQGHSDTIQLRALTRAIRYAGTDSKIRGILLLGNLSPNGYGTGFAALKEVRAALADFRAKGKPIVAYIDYATTKDYYLASAASEIALDPFGQIIMPGLASEPWFVGGLFEKYGIGIQVTRAGKYKSYVESYTRKDMSPENREQIQKLLDDIWGNIVTDISKARSMKPGLIQTTVDTEGLINASAALKSGLVDQVSYRDTIIDQLKKETGVTSKTDSFKQTDLGYYAKTAIPRPPGLGSDEVAIVYAEGEIVEGEGDQTEIGGAKFARELRKLREDSNVKAIVLRVNSPGGSVTASETIQREVRLARKSKPVIVSMGSYAASGGYWISAESDRIFAEPTTITGSIGVFGILPNIQKLANDHGVTFDSVKTGKFADGLLTISRPRTDEELAVFQKNVDWTYQQFLAKVAVGRNLKVERVAEIAQGRVWSGTEGLKIGLVDEIGGLSDAIRYAGKKAGMAEHFKVTEYPKSRDLKEAIAEALGKIAPGSLHMETTGLIGELEGRIMNELKMLKALNDPQGLYARIPVDLEIR
ncbi:MAG TPA: signal peptide peptidase SppA [Opitutaceae bacterium]|nr:signal peptide peptidase SppA [Opitutaceae bacterium]